MKNKVLALLCAVWVAFLPNLCLAQANTVGNTGSPSATGGVRILGTDGTNDQQIQVDASGRFNMLAPVPVMESIQHFSNRTLASGATDSSTTPVSLAGYRQTFALIRYRAGTVGASCELAIRGHLTAQLDSTQGWWFPIGSGGGLMRYGKTIPLTTLADRFQMVALVDSINGTSFQMPYGSIWFVNRTGAQVIYDLWFVGVR